MFVMMHFPPICIGIQDFSWLGDFHNSMWVLEKKTGTLFLRLLLKDTLEKKKLTFVRGCSASAVCSVTISQDF